MAVVFKRIDSDFFEVVPFSDVVDPVFEWFNVKDVQESNVAVKTNCNTYIGNVVYCSGKSSVDGPLWTYSFSS